MPQPKPIRIQVDATDEGWPLRVKGRRKWRAVTCVRRRHYQSVPRSRPAPTKRLLTVVWEVFLEGVEAPQTLIHEREVGSWHLGG